MDELEFAQRLKRYRRERGLTQQELADRIGVSNKSVSRWESGSYPDVPTLLSLARALDVTVDALLDPGAPVPTLQKSDWQNLLSFAFAIGGGLAFYLLRRFVPVPVCWALYLGCLAYGIYLQAHYTYHARWFRLGSWAMCFCVSWTLAEELGGVVFQVLFPTVLSQWKNMIFQLLRGDAGALLQLVLVLGPLWLAGACGLTVLTQLAARRLAGERGDLPVRLPDLRGHPRLALSSERVIIADTFSFFRFSTCTSSLSLLRLLRKSSVSALTVSSSAVPSPFISSVRSASIRLNCTS